MTNILSTVARNASRGVSQAARRNAGAIGQGASVLAAGMHSGADRHNTNSNNEEINNPLSYLISAASSDINAALRKADELFAYSIGINEDHQEIEQMIEYDVASEYGFQTHTLAENQRQISQTLDGALQEGRDRGSKAVVLMAVDPKSVGSAMVAETVARTAEQKGVKNILNTLDYSEDEMKEMPASVGTLGPGEDVVVMADVRKFGEVVEGLKQNGDNSALAGINATNERFTKYTDTYLGLVSHTPKTVLSAYDDANATQLDVVYGSSSLRSKSEAAELVDEVIPEQTTHQDRYASNNSQGQGRGY